MLAVLILNEKYKISLLTNVNLKNKSHVYFDLQAFFTASEGLQCLYLHFRATQPLSHIPFNTIQFYGNTSWRTYG